MPKIIPREEQKLIIYKNTEYTINELSKHPDCNVSLPTLRNRINSEDIMKKYSIEEIVQLTAAQMMEIRNQRAKGMKKKKHSKLSPIDLEQMKLNREFNAVMQMMKIPDTVQEMLDNGEIDRA